MNKLEVIFSKLTEMKLTELITEIKGYYVGVAIGL